MDSLPVVMCPKCSALQKSVAMRPVGAPPRIWSEWRCDECGAVVKYAKKPASPKGRELTRRHELTGRRSARSRSITRNR